MEAFQATQERDLTQKLGFAGTFDKYKPSKILCTFLKLVLIGPHNLDRDRTTQVETVVEVAARIVSQNVKSDRQIQYHQRNPDSLFYSRLETPLNTGLRLYFHHVSRSKKLKNFLADLNLGVNYQKIVNVKKGIVQGVLQKKEENGGVFVTCTLDKDRPIFFEIDNVDLKIDTPDGERQLHATGTAVYQHKLVKQKVYENLKPELKRISGRSVKSFITPMI